jgi:hypothetical protein
MALRKTQNVITHIALSGPGQAHNADQVAFDDAVAGLSETEVQSAIEALKVLIDALDVRVTALEP